MTPTAPWYLWHALRCGVPYAHALDLPHGLLLDLIAVQRIEERGYTWAAQDSDDEFWAVLQMR